MSQDLVQWMNLEFGVVQAELSRFASARLSSPSSSAAVGDLATDAGRWLPPPPRAAVATEEPSPIMSDGGGAIRYFQWLDPTATVSCGSAEQPWRRLVLSRWRSPLLPIFLRHHRPSYDELATAVKTINQGCVVICSIPLVSIFQSRGSS